MPTGVPLPTPSSFEPVREADHLALEVGEGDRPPVALGLALPVVGDLVAVARLDVAVDAVVADVQLAAQIPLRVRRLPLVELREGLEPGDALAPLGLPELVEVAVVDVRPARSPGRRTRRAADTAAPRATCVSIACAVVAHAGSSVPTPPRRAAVGEPGRGTAGQARPRTAAPTGSTGRGDMPLTTPAADVYQATAAVTMPIHPPACDPRAVAVRHAEEADREQDLGDLQGEEHAEDRDVHARAPQQHVRVEDRERDQEPREPVVEVRAAGAPANASRRSASTTKPPSDEPEPAVRRERGGAEHVAVAELPHPRQQLDEAAVEERERRSRSPSGMKVALCPLSRNVVSANAARPSGAGSATGGSTVRSSISTTAAMTHLQRRVPDCTCCLATFPIRES